MRSTWEAAAADYKSQERPWNSLTLRLTVSLSLSPQLSLFFGWDLSSLSFSHLSVSEAQALSNTSSELHSIMNAVSLCNTQLHQPIFRRTQIQPKPNCPNPSIFRRNSKRLLPCRSSFVIQSVEEDQGRVASEDIETPSTPSEFFSRRLILLRHANSSWEDRSLRG